MSLLAGLKEKARRLKAETYALYFAARDSRTPWYAKLLVAAIVAYAMSPIDLIPDFVPVLGYLDDLIVIPLGIAFAVRLVPPAVLAESRIIAHATLRDQKARSWVAGAIIIVIWLALVTLCIVWIYNQVMT